MFNRHIVLYERQQKDLRWIIGPGHRAVTEPEEGILVELRRRHNALQHTTDCSLAESTINGAKGCGA